MTEARTPARLVVRTDEDALQLAGQLLEGLRPGTVVVNHGTGLPGNAVRLTSRPR